MPKTKSYDERVIMTVLMSMLNRASSKPDNAGLISLIETFKEAGVPGSDTGFVLTMGNGEEFQITVNKVRS